MTSAQHHWLTHVVVMNSYLDCSCACLLSFNFLLKFLLSKMHHFFRHAENVKNLALTTMCLIYFLSLEILS